VLCRNAPQRAGENHDKDSCIRRTLKRELGHRKVVRTPHISLGIYKECSRMGHISRGTRLSVLTGGKEPGF
jgi:hypothetical protein